MQESEYFTQELTLDIYYSSRFVQYPHYPIACCLPHLCTMSHNCHSKKKNLTAQIITSRQNEKDSRQKEKDSKQKENLTAKGKRRTAKFIRYREDILILNCFCREVVVILFALTLFFLLWGYSFCREVNSFAVTVMGHRTFEILFPKILDFSTCRYSWELARTLLILLAFKP